MNLTNPISAVSPGGRGVILSVLARTTEPLSGRRIAELAGDQLGKTRAIEVLGELAAAGIVLVESRPPALLYQLNRDHLAADAICQLADLRSTLIEQMRSHLDGWECAPATAWLFGSAARGDGTDSSDIDIAVVRPEGLDADELVWSAQLVEFSDAIARWTGNETNVIEYSESEISELHRAGEPILESIQAEGIRLAGRSRLIPSRVAAC